MTAKLRVKFGDWEIECEGAVDFLKSELHKIVAELAKASGAETPKLSGSQKVVDAPAASSKALNGGGVQATTNSIAATMDYKSGPELIKAALAYLHLVKGIERATRSEIIAEMSTVSGRYKPSMETNFSKQINSLLKDDVNEPEPKKWCLKDGALAEIRARLAQ